MMRSIEQNFDQQQAPAFFARGPSPVARLMFFTALSLALMATDSRFQYLTSIRESLMSLLHPLQVVANVPSQLFHATDEYLSTHHRLLNENARLKKQALVQSVALQRLQLLNLENANLRSLLDAKQSLAESSTLAEVVHVGRDSFTKKIIVNRGKNHQVVTGAAAVDAKGVIGQVTRTYPASSEITLITDKSLAIPVQIERNGLRAIAFGHGRNNTLDLPFLPSNVDIQRGDKLVTSGIDGVYPAGLAVATVIDVKTTQDSPFAAIVCAPTGGVEHDRHVLLVSLSKAASETADQNPNGVAVNPAQPAPSAISVNPGVSDTPDMANIPGAINSSGATHAPEAASSGTPASQAPQPAQSAPPALPLANRERSPHAQ